LAPTSGELTSTVELMASFNNQVVAPSATKLVLPITGGSSSEPANKKQKKEAQRRVQHVGVQ
jgi:type IV pilus biogenesis protein CpaD/CtpE